MRKPRIFIASSGKAKGGAIDLRDQLKATSLFSDVYLWSDVFPLQGEVTIGILRRYAEECDFFAGFFTEDDVVVKEGDEFRAPRDNCIFEAGLFFGALGFNLNRCFLLSSLDDMVLPSDLRGITRVDLKGGIGEAVKKIRARVESTEPRCYLRPKIPVVSEQELFEREQLAAKGGDLRSNVVVNASEPVETDPKGAATVLTNLAYGVDYEYFFEGHARNIPFVVSLIRSLALAKVRTEPTDLDENGWIELMLQSPEQVVKNLENMRKRVSIHFQRKPPLQFCVHNANSGKYAKCYLRYPGDGFVTWHCGADAVAVAEDLTGSCAVPPTSRRGCIFHSTADFNIDAEAEFKAELLDQIEQAFPDGETGPGKIDLRDLARQAAFGVLEARKQPAAAQAP
ncbi:MAG TPA: TIR domain-containing protein [Bryobacteraceae bacterium]|nr:TIR domain-containing protein [Bryobacteraceae bacterium]